MNYDLAPTSPLSGLHLKGTVSRRFLISYAVPPETLSPWIPPGAQLSIHNGAAWVSACVVNLSAMRPSWAPPWMGLKFNYLIHRTRARLPYPDGKRRESVLVLEANINRPWLGWLARKSTGVQFHARDISLTQSSASWTIQMKDEGELLYQAEIGKDSLAKEISPSSQFASAAEADAFLLGVSFGGDWRRDAGQLVLLAETHDPWETLACRCRTSCNAFLESLGSERSEADHVITMTDIPHYFALRGTAVPCPSPSGPVRVGAGQPAA